MVLPVVSVFIAALAGFLQLFLTYQVIRHRRKERVAVGVTGSIDLQRAIRAHGNFVEVTPIFLILLVLAESMDSYLWWIAGLGCAFLVGRGLHAYSMLVDEKRTPPRFQKRVAGMMLTLGTLLAASLSGPIAIVAQLFSS